MDQIGRFERWRRRLPQNTAYLVRLVVDEIVPLFEERGFARFRDYAGGSTYAVGPNCIPLQRRRGSEWPTVEILFHKRMAPSLSVHFGALPEICHRRTITGPAIVEIPRAAANVAEGQVWFSLCKGLGQNFDCNFGYRWWAINPRGKIRSEIEALKSLLPWLFDLFNRGIPTNWQDRPDGYVNRHAFMTSTVRISPHQR
jgi:hypothetical protein